MPIIAIESVRDPRLAAYAAVARPAELAERGLFVAEGRLVVERVLADARYVVESLLLNPAAHLALAAVLSSGGLANGGLSNGGDFPVYVVQGVLQELTGHDFHRGCLGLVRRPLSRTLDEVLASAHTLVVLEGVANPDNLGSVFRNAAAFGPASVLLGPGCADPFYRKAIRTSMAFTLRVPFATLGDSHEPWPQALARLRARGFELVALTPRTPALDLEEYCARRERARPLALLIGAEGAGSSEAAMDLADHRVRIAISSDVDSLNLGVATGIALQRVTSASRSV